MNICLIPTTRKELAKLAILSAESDGWTVITLEDINKNGPTITREELLNIALKEESNIIRYLDDDDTLLPHLSKLDFKDNDIIYANHYEDKCLIKLNGNPNKDIFDIHPWSWIAKTSSLRKIKEYNNFLWNPLIPCREGGWCWYNFIEFNFKFKHLQTTAYQWNKTSNLNSRASNHKDFQLQSQLLVRTFNERCRSTKTTS